MCENRTENNHQTASESSSGLGDNDFRVARPDGATDAQWARIKQRVTARVDQAIAAALAGEELPAFTWRDMLAETPYRRTLLDLVDVDRGELHLLGADLQECVGGVPATGGLLMWNCTRDAEVGGLGMLTGQTVAQQRQVLDNATWLVSCGYVYSVGRVGHPKRTAPDVTIDLEGDNVWVWLIPNDTTVPGMIR